MGDHAILAPSSAEQWGNCAGSVRAQAGRPDTETEASREGTAAHWVVSEVLELYRAGTLRPCSDMEGAQAPNGVIIDETMAEGAQVMVDSVVDVCTRHGAAARLLVEQRVHASRVHPDNWGTLDAALYLPEAGALYVWDYKHGHRDCDAENNLQLINYAAGLVELYDIDGFVQQATRVVLRIVQPFSYHAAGPVKTWVANLADLRAHWNRLANQAHEALSDNPTLTTGKWCRDCKAVGVCSAARKAAYNYVDAVREPYEMDAMGGADLAVERGILRDGLAIAKARLEAIEDELTHRIQSGEDCGGLALEASKGREAWQIPDEQVVTLCGALGVDATKRTIKTPRQTRDAAPKEVRPALEQIMQRTVSRKAGKLNLVQADRTKAARAFTTTPRT